MNFMQMRKIVARELLNYRRSKERLYAFEQRGLRQRATCGTALNGRTTDPTAGSALALLDPPPHIRKIKGWIWSIEQAHAMLQEWTPDRARLMVRLYGLDGAPPAVRNPGWRVYMMDEFNVSEPTLYRWREDILQAVLAGAIQARVLMPYEQKEMTAKLG